MAYEVFARKYRPRVFDDLIGQEAIAQTLRHAVASGRTASVYIFAGSHGVGKTSVARILAKALNCPNAKDGAPCGTCEVCESIARNECLDVVEIDAASNSKVEDVRLLRESVGYKPASCRFKVYILDEVQRLSGSAFDALLKTFEESPPLVRFVLATTELHKVPTTILSRAQVFRFQRAGLDDIVRSLRRICEAEKLAVEDEALRAIGRRARGSMRDSQKLLDQVVALRGGGAAGTQGGIVAADVAFLLGDATTDVVARCLGAIVRGSPAELLKELDQHVRAGGKPDALGADLMEALRGTLYLKTAGESSPLLEDVALPKEDLRPAADALSEESLLYALQLLQEAQMNMREVRDPRLTLELVLVRLARVRELVSVGEILARLQRLERGGAGGTESPHAATAAPRATSVAPPPSASRPAPSPAPAPAPAAVPPSGLPRPVAPPPPSPPPSSARAGYQVPAEFARPGTAVAAAPVTLERVHAVFEQVREAARQQSASLARALERARIKGLAGGRLTIETSAPSFIFSQLETPALRDPLAALFREALGGERLELVFERVVETPAEAAARPAPGASPAPAAPAGAPTTPGTRSVYDEPVVKLAQRVLGSQSTAGGW
jgi:DNA polymerase-3 subunit gamma/tau